MTIALTAGFVAVTFLASDDDGDLAMAAVMSLALFWAAGIWIVAALKKLGIPFNVVYKWYTLRIYIWIYWGSNPYRIESTSGWIWWFFSIATSTRNEEIYWEYVLIILFDFSWIGALRRKSKEAFAGWYQCWRLVHSEDCCHLTPGWRLLVVPLVRAYLWNPGSLRMLQILPGGPRLALLVFYSVLVDLQLRAGGGSRQILSGRAKVLVASEDQLQGSRWRWRGTLNSRMPPSQNLADFNIFHSNSRASELKSRGFRGCYGSQWPICFFNLFHQGSRCSLLQLALRLAPRPSFVQSAQIPEGALLPDFHWGVVFCTIRHSHQPEESSRNPLQVCRFVSWAKRQLFASENGVFSRNVHYPGGVLNEICL